MFTVILYSTNCPKCKILEKKLNNAEVNYQINTNVEEMLKMGLLEAPALKVNDVLMDFKEANKWIGEQYGN